MPGLKTGPARVNFDCGAEGAGGALWLYGNESQPGAQLGDPGPSNVDFGSGQNVAAQTASNAAIVTTSVIVRAGRPTGSVSSHNAGSGPVDLIVDVAGNYGASATLGGPTRSGAPVGLPGTHHSMRPPRS